jgi:hypothetical protein
MPRCQICGNDYSRAFKVIAADGSSAVFDSLECAAHLLAPTCAHCGCRVLGHGIESGEHVYCCAHCARQSGERRAVDNTTQPAQA